MAKNLSDSSDLSSSDKEILEPERKVLKTRHFDDRATSKFYTKDESQEDLPYVADNVFKIKKSKQIKHRKRSLHSTDQSSNKKKETFNISKDIKYAKNCAPNNHEKSYLNNPVAFMKSDSEYNQRKKSLSSSEDSSDNDNTNCFSNYGTQLKKEKIDGASCSRTIDSDSDTLDDAPPKANQNFKNNEKTSNKGLSLMKKIGYKEGEGLGKNAQGLVDPVQLPTQKGRRGLGFTSREPRESFVLDWNPEQEESVDIFKVTEWLENKDSFLFSFEDMNDWIQTSEKKLTYNQTTEFADSEIFKVVNSSKNVLDNINDHDFRHARTKANPFETIKNGIFQNRAAMKMANIDWACDFMFTDPKYSDGSHMLSTPSSLLYFADICAGPGGFSEYVLWRKGWKAKGVGFTLRNENDFKLNDFYAGSPESFEAYYGCGDGDIYKPKNITLLERYVMKMTEGKGVHFVMADGGFSVEGQESFQEILSKRLYLCQALAALSILQPGGHFMCKVFDIFTEYSAGLLFLLHHSFKQISIYKPVTSRPANSERYVICKWRLEDVQDVKKYLYTVNLTWDKLGPKEDILSIVPLEHIINDSNFFNYLWESNNKLGQMQALSLSKIVAYTKDQRLADERQKNLKKKCLEMWEVKDGVRRAPFRNDPQDACNSLVSGSKKFLQLLPEVLNKENLRKYIKSVYDWHCVLLNISKPPTYFLSLGGSQVYELVQNRWVSNEYLKNVTMSPGTLVYGELAIELEGQDLGQLRVRVLHIIDAYKLGNIDISNEHYLTRVKYCKDFAKSMNKIESDQMKIRVKEPVYLENITDMFDKVDLRWSKCHRKDVKMYMLDNEKYCCASGILFIKATRYPWVRALSRTYNSMYYGHPTMNAIYEEGNPVAAYAPFSECCSSNKVWYWMDESGNQVKTPILELQLEQEDFEKLMK